MHRVHAAGYDCEELKSTGVVLGKPQPAFEEDGLELTFGTQSGKIELFSKPLQEAGFDPLPNFTPPEEPPPGTFRMLFGRAPSHSFGRTTNNRLLCEVFSENEVWVNDRICTELGIADGDRVMLINQDDARSGPIRVKSTRRIRPDCVYLVHGWGTKEKGLTHAFGKGASDSDLVTRYKTDPLMGGTGMNVNFVRVERV